MFDIVALPHDEARIIFAYLKRAGLGKLLRDDAGDYLLSVTVLKQLIQAFGREFLGEIGLTYTT